MTTPAEPPGALTLSFGDSTLLEKLYGVLVTNGVSSEKAQTIKDDLIQLLYSPIKTTSLQALHAASQRCVVCPEMEHDAWVPVWNKTDPQAVFIVESPNSLSHAGRKLFLNSLIMAGFSAETTCCTYVTRCSKREKITDAEITNCSNLYLFTELQMMRPRVIIPLGAVPTKILLGPEAKVTELTRSNDAIWLGPWCTVANLGPNHIASSDDKDLLDIFTSRLDLAAKMCSLTKEVQAT